MEPSLASTANVAVLFLSRPPGLNAHFKSPRVTSAMSHHRVPRFPALLPLLSRLTSNHFRCGHARPPASLAFKSLCASNRHLLTEPPRLSALSRCGGPPRVPGPPRVSGPPRIEPRRRVAPHLRASPHRATTESCPASPGCPASSRCRRAAPSLWASLYRATAREIAPRLSRPASPPLP